MLGHLSKVNNFPELALKTVIEELHIHNYDETDIDLSVADRYKPSQVISIDENSKKLYNIFNNLMRCQIFSISLKKLNKLCILIKGSFKLQNEIII